MDFNLKNTKSIRNIVAAVFLFFCANLYAQISVEYFGAAQRVSGSCALLQTDQSSVIVDCGTFYGEEGLESDNIFLDDRLLKAKTLILTHAHIDHSGRIPYLISKGFKGDIYSTEATKKIVFEMYDDGWSFEDVKQKYFWSSRKMANINKIHKGVLTLHFYDQCRKSIKDINACQKEVSICELEQKYKINFKICKKCLKKHLDDISKQFKEVKYNVPFNISGDIKVTFLNAGHISGSISAVFDILNNSENKRVIFSGDLGSGYSNITQDKQIPPKADCIFIESTYGGLSKNITLKDYDKFQNALAAAVKKNKTVWIPSLALHRTQKVLYEIKKAQDKGLIAKNIKVFSLSPSSNGLTKLYENEIKHPSSERWFSPDVYDGGTLLPANYTTKKPQKFPKPSIVISAGGMMDMGTSVSLVSKFLSSDDTVVFLVSYAGPHTPAGQLKRQAEKVKTKYGYVNVLADVEIFDIFSDHPDIDQLLKWLSNQNFQTKIYLVHGNKDNLKKAKNTLIEKGFSKTEIVSLGKIIIN